MDEFELNAIKKKHCSGSVYDHQMIVNAEAQMRIDNPWMDIVLPEDEEDEEESTLSPEIIPLPPITEANDAPPVVLTPEPQPDESAPIPPFAA